VSSLEVLYALEKIRLIAQRARDGAKPADVLGMAPAGIVPAAVAV
jgi:hypothetical protein